MKGPLSAEQIPVTLLIALAYVTFAVVTGGLTMGADPEKLLPFGTLTPLLVAQGDWWRLLANAFLHGGLLHLGFNTMMLMSVGPVLERSLGSARFAGLYVVSALGGSLAVCLLYDPLGSVVGGSGALFGMLGSLVALNMRSGRHLFSFLDFEGPRRLLGMIAANLVIGFLLPFISNTAHIGGLVAGFATTFFWLEPPRAASASLRHWRVAITALFVSGFFASVRPVTRWDWLWNRSVVTVGERASELQRAAAMSYFGISRATDADVARFVAKVVDPPAPGERRQN